MSKNINSHLPFTEEQKKLLKSFPASKFTDRKWESQNDAASFLREHNLTLENNPNNPEKKWKVRYSDKARGIRLLQCCCGSDIKSLKKQNNKTKIRKSRQMYKFVGCLAFARIKKYKNNSIGISGYLSHLENCVNYSNDIEDQINSWERSNNELRYPWPEFNAIYNNATVFRK